MEAPERVHAAPPLSGAEFTECFGDWVKAS